MQRYLWAVIAVMSISLSLCALSIRTQDGQTLHNVKIDKVSFRGIHMQHDMGVGVYTPEQIIPAYHKYLTAEIKRYKNLKKRKTAADEAGEIKRAMDNVRKTYYALPDLAAVLKKYPDAPNAAEGREMLKSAVFMMTSNVNSVIKKARILLKDESADDRSVLQHIEKLQQAIKDNPGAPNHEEANIMIRDLQEKILCRHIDEARKKIEIVRKNPEKYKELDHVFEALRYAAVIGKNAPSFAKCETVAKEIIDARYRAIEELRRREEERRHRESRGNEERDRREYTGGNDFRSIIPIANGKTFTIDWSFTRDDALNAGGKFNSENKNICHLDGGILLVFASDGGLQEFSISYFDCDKDFFVDALECALKYYDNSGDLYENTENSSVLLGYMGKHDRIYYAVSLIYRSSEGIVRIHAYNANYCSEQDILKTYRLVKYK